MSTDFRLFPVAPNKDMVLFLKLILLSGISIFFSPERYFPVIDDLQLIKSFGFPKKVISPPSIPAPGPMSTTKSADSIVSLSCSTTMIELPISLNDFKVFNKRSLSRGCNPIEGSSNT